MSETPEQAYVRLKAQLLALKKARAQIPVLVYTKAAQEAVTRINEAMSRIFNVHISESAPAGYPLVGDEVLVAFSAEDQASAQSCFGSIPGKANWAACQRYDFDLSGKVDGLDLAALSRGQHAVVTGVSQDAASKEWFITVLTTWLQTRVLRIGDILSIVTPH